MAASSLSRDQDPISTHPTPSYRIAVSSGTGAGVSGPDPTPSINPTIIREPEPKRHETRAPPTSAFLIPPAVRPARLSLPNRLDGPAGAANQNRQSLPPPPPTPAQRARARLVFSALVTQFFLALGCLFSATASCITFFCFGLDCYFKSTLVTELAVAVLAFTVVMGQLVTVAIGIGAFRGKARVDTKTHLLIAYVGLDIWVGLMDVGLAFIGLAGSVVSFAYYNKYYGDFRYREALALALCFAVFGITAAFHLIFSFAIALILCRSDGLFNQSARLITPTASLIRRQQKAGYSQAVPKSKKYSEV